MCYQITLYPMVHFSHNTETIVCYGILKMSHVTRKHHKGKMTRGGEQENNPDGGTWGGDGGGTANGPGVPEDPLRSLRVSSTQRETTYGNRKNNV